ncbi:PREDICTED: very-long-chain enoyl-CoA reductase-like, partial [Priapulus caudatus]|uniref:Very-long-chain enoyl-CoA reductase-like n=1 Tax=Priapulus caudatus TaxID=37621 RepID=A0ABM1F0C8_PRICU
MEVVVVNAKSGQELARLGDLSPSATILDVKKAFHKHGKKTAPSRQSFKLEAKGKMLKDEETLKALNLPPGGKLYFKDLGPQVGWKTVFLVEYAGPLAIYMSIYWWQPRFLYGAAHADPRFPVTHLAAACWTLHYSKRLLETVFVH